MYWNSSTNKTGRFALWELFGESFPSSALGGWGEGGLSSPECERSGLQGEARGEGQSPGNLRWDAAGGQKGMCDLQLEHFP